MGFGTVEVQEILTVGQSHVIAVLATISGCVSVGFCLLLITLYTWFQEYKTFHMRLIYVQTWLDLLLSIWYIAGANSRSALINSNDNGVIICDFQGGILQLLALRYPERIWHRFPLWLRTYPEHGCPSENVVRLTLQHELHRISLTSRRGLLLAKILDQKQRAARGADHPLRMAA